MNLQTNFNKLVYSITLTTKQKEDAKTKYTGVCKTLSSNYYINQTYDEKKKILIGSYGKSTNIRPPTDVDVIFRLPETEYERFSKYQSNGQSALLQEIRNMLSETYSTTDKINSFGKVIVCNFKDGTHNVELLPAFDRGDGKFIIPNSENSGSWETFYIKDELENISNSNKSTGITLDIIRIIKEWKRYCNVDISSFKIELLVVEYLKTISDYNLYYGDIVNNFLNYTKNRINIPIFNPGDKSFIEINTGDFESKIDSAVSRSEKALGFEKENKFADAILEWKKIFGNNFSSNIPAISKELIIRDPGERFITDLGIGLYNKYTLKINGETLYLKPSMKLSEISSIEKGVWIRFFIEKTNFDFLSEDYSIYWKVKNRGEDAKKDLRGEISERGKEIIEHTQYIGSHFVECYIVVNDECVASDRIYVNIK